MTIDSFVSQLCQHCGVAEEELSVVLTDTDETLLITVNLPESESGRFIGYHGETLAALQRVVRLAFEKELNKRIVLNINNYREQREEQLGEKARHAVEQVVSTGQPYIFPNLSSSDRFIVHSAVGKLSTPNCPVESLSEGEGQARRLVVRLKVGESVAQGDTLTADSTQNPSPTEANT